MLDFSPFRAVIFDFDGVILDSETLQARAWSRAGRELGIADCDIRAAQIAGRIDVELAVELFPQLPDPMACARLKWQLEAEMEAAGELAPVPGVIGLLDALRPTHRLAICSSSRPEQLEQRLALCGLRDRFEIVTGRLEGVPHKPAPDLYRFTLATLNLRPGEHACAIEDSPTGVAAAKGAGLYTIQLVHDGMPVADSADARISSYEQLKNGSI